ncbi:tubulin--tyrosine ligase-like [Watersipora subatra]|uniref:tubulin--tyrosine ligase-like n=1 Tax=Watersipora subatra TaxID=2589382 RepID=UPI00355C5383
MPNGAVPVRQLLPRIMTYILINRDPNSSIYKQVAKTLLARGSWKRAGPSSLNFNLMFGDRNNLPYNQLGQQPGQIQLVNYYRGSSELCRKVSSFRLLRSYREQFGLEGYDFLPESYIIVPKSSHSANQPPVKDDRDSLLERHTNSDHIWIAKISTGSKGLGIIISRNIQELLSAIDGQGQSHIVQRYIETPLLLPKNRKFDIRVWVLLDQQYNVYIYREGVVRTCSDAYDPHDITKLTSHLSNHCLQEQLSPNFGLYEPNNEIFFSEFDSILTQISSGRCSLYTDILPQVDKVVSECLLAIQTKISPTGFDYQSFQLFGFDFLLDDTYKVWLLEINGAPAASRSLRDEMADSIIQVCIDPIFPEGANLSPEIKHNFRPLDFVRGN